MKRSEYYAPLADRYYIDCLRAISPVECCVQEGITYINHPTSSMSGFRICICHVAGKEDEDDDRCGRVFPATNKHATCNSCTRARRTKVPG